MRRWLWIAVALLACAALAPAQTVDELVSKNLQAMGGLDKINAIKTLRMTGHLQQGGVMADVAEEWKAPNLIRESFTLQGMTQTQAYNGSIGWQISPFEGRKDPERLGEDDTRDLIEDAYLFDPLVDYQAKGSTVEYLGMGTVDGDDAYKLKVTLKNGDILYYYLDPDTFMGIRLDRQQFLRGAMRERVQSIGAYKQVDGVYFPFSIEASPKSQPANVTRIALDKVEANIEVPNTAFDMPAPPAAASPQKHEEPPAKPKAQKPPKPPQKG